MINFGRLPNQGRCLALLMLALPLAADAKGPFEGAWHYESACGLRHIANLELRQQGDEVTGRWDDGNVVSGTSGKLKGTIRDDQLVFQVCQETESRGISRCPKYDLPTAYLRSNGDGLTWIRTSGGWERTYMSMRRADDRTALVVDSICEDDEQ